MFTLLHKKHKSTKSKMAYGDEDRTEVNSDLTVLQNWKIARPSYAEKGDSRKPKRKGQLEKKGSLHYHSVSNATVKKLAAMSYAPCERQITAISNLKEIILQTRKSTESSLRLPAHTWERGRGGQFFDNMK